MEDILNKQVDTRTWPLDISQLAALTIPELAHCVHEWRCHSGRAEAMRELNSIYKNAHYQGWFSYCHLWGSDLPATETMLSPLNDTILWGDQPIILWQVNCAGLLPCWKNQWFIFTGNDNYLEYGFVFLARRISVNVTIWGLTQCLIHGHKIPHNTAFNQKSSSQQRRCGCGPKTLRSTHYTTYSASTAAAFHWRPSKGANTVLETVQKWGAFLWDAA